MPIKFRCPHCRQKLEISSKKAGVKLNCPACQKSINVPSLEDINAAVRQQQAAKLKKEQTVSELPDEVPSNLPSTKPVSSPQPETPADTYDYEESQPLSTSQLEQALKSQESFESNSPESSPSVEESQLPPEDIDNSQLDPFAESGLTSPDNKPTDNSPELSNLDDLLEEPTTQENLLEEQIAPDEFQQPASNQLEDQNASSPPQEAAFDELFESNPVEENFSQLNDLLSDTSDSESNKSKTQENELWDNLLSEERSSDEEPSEIFSHEEEQPATPDYLDDLFSDETSLDEAATEKETSPANELSNLDDLLEEESPEPAPAFTSNDKDTLDDISEFEEVEEFEEDETLKPAAVKQTTTRPARPPIPTTFRNWSEDDEDDDSEKKTIPPQEDMDLTPMVDVTFLLLIFFMLTASFSIQKSIPTPKPDPKGKGAVQAVSIEDLEKDTIVVEITAENQILVDDVEISNPDDLTNEIVKASNKGEKNEVVIQPDPQALHEFTVKVIDAANEAGMQKIRLADVNES